MEHLVFILITIITLSSCAKKERSIKVSGNIYDPALNQVVAGATVKLKAAKIESGVYNSNYTEVEKVTTDASGDFAMEVLVQKVSGYRFVVEKDDYFEIEKEEEL